MTIDGKSKQCKGRDQWLSADEIINDPDIRPIGMSFPVDVSLLEQYAYKHIPEQNLIMTDNRAGHCVNIEDLVIVRMPVITPHIDGFCLR